MTQVNQLKVAAFAFLLVLLTSCGSGKESITISGDFRYPVKLENLWGVIDENGKYVLNPTYSSEPVFSDGKIMVRKAGTTSYFDKDGNPLISDKEGTGGAFFEGLAPFSTADGKVGYIDETGNWKITPTFEAGGPFSEGLASARVDGKWGFINTEGKWVINPQFDEYPFPFIESMSIFTRDDKYGFINNLGQEIIPPTLEEVAPFSEGLAIAKFESMYGYIDPAGKLQINPQFSIGHSFSNELAAVKMDSKYGFINPEGKMVINPQFEGAIPFSEGLAPVILEKKFGYINTEGNWAVPPQYAEAGTFFNGLAPVKLESKYGFIDPEGKYQINPQFSEVSLILMRYGYKKDLATWLLQGVVAGEISPEYVARKFLEVLRAGDYEAAKPFATKKTIEYLDLLAGMDDKKSDRTDLPNLPFEILGHDINRYGNAVVRYQDDEDGKEKDITLIKEGDSWKASWTKDEILEDNGDSLSNDYRY